ncbi:hypothetical protein BGZ58_007982 [Dissophora ornata]|nr:hypothetical protein BGZ58_007982 [Dissophora ornata]
MRFGPGVLLITAAANAQAEFDALESGALFLGTDTSDPKASGPAVFREPNNHPSAVASIVWFSANKAQFCPAEAEVVTDPLAYDNFVVALYRFPGFEVSKIRKIPVRLSGDLGRFVDEIKEQLDESDNKESSEDMREIAVRLKDLIPPFVEDRSWKRWALTAVVIRRGDSGEHEEGSNSDRGRRRKPRITLETVKLVLRLSREEYSGKTGVESQSTVLSRTTYNIDSRFLVKHAERLTRNIDTISVGQFMEVMSTMRWDMVVNKRYAGDAMIPCGQSIPSTGNIFQRGHEYPRLQRWMGL